MKRLSSTSIRISGDTFSISKKLLLVIFLLTILLPFISSPAPAGDIEIDIKVQRHILDNGLKILTLEDHSVPVISYYTFFRVGSRNEYPGITGISHLFEHMMFNGAKKYGPKEFDRVLESNGGYSNAYTTKDITVYYEVFPSDKLEIILDLETDRMADLSLIEETLKSEREVVKEERRLRTENSIFGLTRENLFAAAFFSHPYMWPVVGWMSDLNRITLKDCKEYFKTYYAPNNATVVIVGDFDTEKAISLVKKYYSRIRSQTPPAPVRTEEAVQRGERRVKVYKTSEMAALMIGYHVPSVSSQEIFTLDIIQMILAEGESSRLYRRLVYDKEMVPYVYAYFNWTIDPGLFYFYTRVKPGYEPEEVEREIYAELDSLSKKLVSEKELRKAKNLLQADFIKNLQTNSGKANTIGRYELLFGDWTYMKNTLSIYEEVTAEDVKELINKYFNSYNRSVSILIPEEPAAKEVSIK